MVTYLCRECGHAAQTDKLYDALEGSASPALTNTHLEMLRLMADKGPITLKQLEVFPREHVGSRGGTVSAKYVRRMLTDINRRLDHVHDILVVAESGAPGGSVDDPVLAIFIAPDSEWAALDGAAPHVNVSQQMAAMEAEAEEETPAPAIDLGVGETPEDFADQ